MLAIRLALAAVLMVSGIAKLLAPKSTAAAAERLGIPAGLTGTVAILLPVAELGTAALLSITGTSGFGGAAATVLLLAFTGVIAANLRQGRRPACACFGALSADSRIGPGTLVRNLLLLAAAVAVTVAALFPGTCTVGCYNADGLRQLAIGGAVALVAGVGVCLAMVASLTKLVGELAGRVRELEGSAPGTRRAAPVDPDRLARVLGRGRVQDADGGSHPVVGLAVPERRTLLLFLSAQCPACSRVTRGIDSGEAPPGLGYVALIDSLDAGPDSVPDPEAPASPLRRYHDVDGLADAAGIQAFPSAVVLDGAGQPTGPILVGSNEIRAYLDAQQGVMEGV